MDKTNIAIILGLIAVFTLIFLTTNSRDAMWGVDFGGLI